MLSGAVDQAGKTGNFSGCGSRVEDALTTYLGNNFLGDLQFFLSLLFVACLSFRTHFFGHGFDQGAVTLVSFVFLFVLPVAFQCRFMISQNFSFILGVEYTSPESGDR